MRAESFPAILCLCLGLLSPVAVEGQVLPDFTVLVEENGPAIVHVGTTRVREALAPDEQRDFEELLRYYLGDRMPDFVLPEPGTPERVGSGSGFIIDADGYIVTNHHVVAGADGITVTLNDRREYTAEVIGSDPLSDLALLKIPASGLYAARLGDSSRLKVGEWVLAIGSPFGLQYSVAAGIVSYMGRALPSDGGNYVSYIQTDVAINPGHSGGPLFNLAGEVVGINAQIFTNSGGSIGLSFAIPADVARNVLAQLREHGTVSRGWMGVSYEDVSQALAEAFRLDTPHGALINRVIDGSPAATAGFRVGDIVVGFDEHVVRVGADLPFHVGQLMPGTEVQVDIIRDGKPLSLAMTVGRLEGSEAAMEQEPLPEPSPLGLTVSVPDPDVLAILGLEHGLLVEEAVGAAREAGLRTGDILVSLDGIALITVADLERVAADLPAGRAIPVLVARGERQSFFTLRLEQP